MAGGISVKQTFEIMIYSEKMTNAIVDVLGDKYSIVANDENHIDVFEDYGIIM